MDEAVVFLCKGGCSFLLLCGQVNGIEVIPQCRYGGRAKDRLVVVDMWFQLVGVASVGWNGGDGLSQAKEAGNFLPRLPALGVFDFQE